MEPTVEQLTERIDELVADLKALRETLMRTAPTPNRPTSTTPAETLAGRKYLIRAEVVKYLNENCGLRITYDTLNKWAHSGRGPKYRLIGRHTAYALADVEAWLASLKVRGGETSDLDQ